MKKENDLIKIFIVGCSSIFASAGVLLLMTQMILPWIFKFISPPGTDGVVFAFIILFFIFYTTFSKSVEEGQSLKSNFICGFLCFAIGALAPHITGFIFGLHDVINSLFLN